MKYGLSISYEEFMRSYSVIANVSIDSNVSKIVIPAQGYYQVVLSDGSNTTFKDDGNGDFECLNAHSKMEKDGDGYVITNAAQSKYHFNSEGELDWVKDAEGNILTVSAMTNNQRIVTDSTGRNALVSSVQFCRYDFSRFSTGYIRRYMVMCCMKKIKRSKK